MSHRVAAFGIAEMQPTQPMFVTGATGFLGNSLVRHLVDRGYHVRALVRSAAKAEVVLGQIPNIELIVGDMANVPAFADALIGCDCLFHTAAYYRDYFRPGPHSHCLERVN